MSQFIQDGKPHAYGDDGSYYIAYPYGRVIIRDKYGESKVIEETPIPQAHGLVGAIADWITETAIRPQPLLSLVAALAFVGMLKGHRVRGYTDLRTNLLIMSLAPTAAGKEHPQNCLKRLAAAAGVKGNLMGEPVSGAGFLTGLNKCGRVGLLIMDEMGRYLANISSKNSGGFQREIVDYMIKTFSCANSTLYGRQYANEKINPTINIDYPHFCCLGSTVVERFRAACSSTEIIDGFLNRWLVFHVEGRPERQQKVKFSEPPDALVAQVRALVAESPYDAYGEPKPKRVVFTPEAWDAYKEYRTNIDLLVAASKPPIDALYSRIPEQVEKVALTMAGDGCIVTEDLRFAISLVELSRKSVLRFVDLVSDNIHEQDFIRVREIIKEAKTIKRSALYRKSQFVQGGARRLNEIITTLKDEDMVIERTEGNCIFYDFAM